MKTVRRRRGAARRHRWPATVFLEAERQCDGAMPISASRNLLQRGLGTRITTEIVAPHRLLVNCSRDRDIADAGRATDRFD